MKPKRIFLIRHGESQGNVDENVYKNTPDYAVLLTDKGKNQAQKSAETIKDIIGLEEYGIYYSPYFRARQTMDNALQILNIALCKFKKEEPRIREQEYSGYLRDIGKHAFEKEREAYGKFFYRLDGGESGADIWDRTSDFIGTMHRDFNKENFPENVLIFTHGMAMRIFIMRFFKFTVEEFEMWKNPKNGEIYILELQENNKYKLMTEIAKHPKPYGKIYNV